MKYRNPLTYHSKKYTSLNNTIRVLLGCPFVQRFVDSEIFIIFLQQDAPTNTNINNANLVEKTPKSGYI